MKASLLKHALATLILAAALPQFSTGFAQGSLTPPGAPAATMKSLDQIEPRIIVNAANTPGDATDMFIISRPGSYYLTTNLIASAVQNGITITTNDVTLDLNGFALKGLPGTYTGTAVNMPGIRTNLTVRNGSISGWGTTGVQQYSATTNSYLSANLLFEHLDISACRVGIYVSGLAVIRECHVINCVADGIDYDALNAGSQGGIISGCTVAGNGGVGINDYYANVSGCTANDNLMNGIDVSFGNVSDCIANDNVGNGIDAYYANVSGSTVIGNGDTGIYSGGGGGVSGSLTFDNDGYGIIMYDGSLSGCNADNNGGDGIYAKASTVTGSSAVANGDSGIEIYNGTVSGCAATGNGDSGILGGLTAVSGCTAEENSNNGIELDSAGNSVIVGKVADCMVQDNVQNGIFVIGTGGLITGNSCDNNNTSTNSGCAGITIYYSSGNRIENNHISGDGYAGINVSGSNNLIIKNSVTGNGANDYIINGTEMTGPIITATGIISSTSPWANFAF